MTYTVVWKPEAERKLTLLWVESSDRDAISQAANRIDHVLSVDPTTAGESRDEDRRVLLDPPLGVVYKVIFASRTVVVLSVWRFD